MGLKSEIIFVTLADPDAGAEWTHTIPASRPLVRLVMVSMRLTAANTGTARVVGYEAIGPSSFVRCRVEANQTQAINTPRRYVLDASGNSYISDGNEIAMMALPEVYLQAGDIVRSRVRTINAGDQWNSVHLQFERYDTRS